MPLAGLQRSGFDRENDRLRFVTGSSSESGPLGSTVIMLGDAMPQWPAKSNSLYVYVEDVDATYKRAIQAGGTSVREPSNQFYGDRSGGVIDSAGNRWHIGTHVEDVSPAELKKRATEFMKQQHKAA